MSPSLSDLLSGQRIFDIFPIFILCILLFSLCNCSSQQLDRSRYVREQYRFNEKQEQFEVPLRLISLGDTREGPILALFRSVAEKFSKEAGIRLRVDSLETMPYPSLRETSADERLASFRRYVNKNTTHESQAIATVVFLPRFEKLEVSQEKLHGLAEGIGTISSQGEPDHSALALVVRSGQIERDALVFAHELGHLLGAEHSLGGLMSVAHVRRSTQFSPRTILAMQRHLRKNTLEPWGDSGAAERALFWRDE